RARRAALEVRPHARNDRVGLGARELELDVAVELLKALIAGELRAARAGQGREQTVSIGKGWCAHDDSRSPSMPMPLAPSAALSFCRASWRVLYRAPRVVLSRSASTSIGTPLSVIATSTSRWCGLNSPSIASPSAASVSVVSTDSWAVRW